MKKIKHLALILFIILCLSSSAFANFFVVTSDQFGATLSDVWSHGYYSYNGQYCDMGFVWEQPGVNTFSQFQYWSSWPIWPPTGVAGCLNVPTNPCGGRYSFDRITAGSWMFDVGYTDFMHKPFTPNSSSVGNPYLIGYSRACSSVVIQDGESDVYALYQKNGRVQYNYYVLNPGNGQYEYQSGWSTNTWYPIGQAKTFTAPNLEASNHLFYYTASQHGTWGQQWLYTPTGTVPDEDNGNPNWIIDWHYKPGRSTTLSVTLPPWGTTPFENAYDIQVNSTSIKNTGTRTYWQGYGTASTITLPEKIAQVVGGIEEIWVLNVSGITLPAGATLTYDSATRKYRIQQPSLTNNAAYSIVYNKLTVNISGVDVPAHITMLKTLPGLTLTDYSINQMHLIVPNEIYADDDGSGNYNAIRYVLTGWTGNGNIPTSGTPDAGAFTTITSNLISESTVTWNYKKQIRVTVTTKGESNPLKVYDLRGSTNGGSAIVSLTTTTSLNPTSNLVAGMAVYGYGIVSGTTISTVNVDNTVTLTSAATYTYTASAGQRLTFATIPGTGLLATFPTRTGDISSVSNIVTNISSTNLVSGMTVTGAGIQIGTTVTSVNVAGNTVTLSTTALATSSNVDLTFMVDRSADPRECESAVDVCAADAGASQSGVRFYDLVRETVTYDVNLISLTAKNQFVELDASGVPVTRSFTAVQYSAGGMANLKAKVNERMTLATFNRTAPMTVTWSYDKTKYFPVGKPIEPISLQTGTVNPNVRPTIVILTPTLATDTPDSAFVWAWDSSNAGSRGFKYFPIHPVDSFKIRWPLTDGTFVEETGSANWDQEQAHIAKAPAMLQPPGAETTFDAISYSTNGATANMGTFNAMIAGWTVLRFKTPAIANVNGNLPGTAFIVVKTEALDPAYLVENPWKIGAKITDASHRDPENEVVPSKNKTGYLYFPMGGVYDGVGSDKAYDPDTRIGAIIPVNKSLPGDVNPLVVVWYEKGQGRIGWPTNPMRYAADWPLDTDPGLNLITIGTGTSISPTTKPRAMVYNQPDSGKPGYNPNEEHALITGDALYALRDDLNAIQDISRPYVLVKYYNDNAQEWSMDVYKVVRPASFTFAVKAGFPILPPLPASFQVPVQSVLKQSAPGREWYLRDEKQGHWAKAANWVWENWTQNAVLPASPADKSQFVMQWYYYMRSDFYWPGAGALAKKEGDVVPFLNDGSINVSNPKPIDVTYVTYWPENTNTLAVGDTLTFAKNDLPEIYNFKSAEIIFDENVYHGNGPLVKLYAPERYLYTSPTDTAGIVRLPSLPDGIKTEIGPGGVITFTELPYAIQARLFYDDINKRLGFKGTWIANEGEDPWLLPNLMTDDERVSLHDVFSKITGTEWSGKWNAAVDELYALARNPNLVTFPTGTIIPANPYSAATDSWHTKWGIKLGLAMRDKQVVSARSIIGEKNALSAGLAQGEGYVVIAENNDVDLKAAPVALHVIRVSKDPVFQGEIKAIKSKNVFDEKLTLHYTGDFGGEPEKFNFEWYYQPVSGGMPNLPLPGPATGAWGKYMVASNVTGTGMTDITIQGASPMTMSDNWVAARYYYKNAWPAPISVVSQPTPTSVLHDDMNNWSEWSGSSKWEPMLAMGWIKRVIDDLNPLEARVTDFRNNATNTTVSMISQFGTRYEGSIALNSDAGNLNSLGMIPAYETVLNRGRQFSIDANPPQDYGPTNDALLNVTSRLATFYLALGNEAYADAVDPTIGFSTKSAEYGNMAPSVFAFQNQLDSLLEEELALMRGRDDTSTTTKNAPYYNRLVWNFTQGEGEVAYAQNYNITDQDKSGVINAGDARIMYPQGHGDAWGHYLQAIDYYYKLLGHPSFSWEPRVEFVLVAGKPIMVDYLDERKFASIAAARAKTGAEILDLTYRKLYTDDPAGQWQGYKDTYADRAWGVDEWARRAGQAAFFDWVTANAILPEKAGNHDRMIYDYDWNPAHKKYDLLKETIIPGADIQQIDRSTTPELRSIASEFHKIQAKISDVDSGVNPLGLVKGVVPFDIDPAFVVDSGYGASMQTHFEQIYDRAQKALESAIAVYDYANSYSQRLRQNQDTLEEFKKNLTDQERDYKNRLIEIFGYPYGDDIGPGKTYPDGYNGPDIFHYNYVDYTELTGKKNEGFKTFKRDYTILNSFLPYLGGLKSDTTAGGEAGKYTQAITYNISTDSHWQVKDPTWTLKRRAPGKIQQALSDMIVAEANFNKARIELDCMIGGIEDAKNNLETRYQVLADQLTLRNVNEGIQCGLDVAILVLHSASLVFKRVSAITDDSTDAIVAALPISAHIDGGDLAFAARGATKATGIGLSQSWAIAGDVADGIEFGATQVKERIQAQMELRIEASEANYEVWKLVQELNAMIADVDPKLLETYQLQETLQQAVGNYHAAVAEGVRVWDELTEKRAQAAAEVQEYRFQDLGFRVFRNDAIQKYRAQFDLAAKYVYLAATAYDYETNLLGTDAGTGRKFLSDIARQRTLGVVMNNTPMAGFPGLADIMARLSQNFNVYKTQLGFNNPQTETTPFSLRTELFRIRADAGSDKDWKDVLKDHKVDDLWKIPEFKRYCRPFAPESAGPQPGIVIKFPTTVTYGKNFFGWPLSGGDSAYSSSNFSTKVRSVGLWFENYDNAGLSSTPRVYLVPTGADILRSPTGNGFATREWQVRDQKLPVPFPIGDSDLNNPLFIPINDSLGDELNGMRKVSDFRAYPYSGEFDSSQATTDSRLIGRSVWNTQWMMIIPGSTLLFNKDVGLNTFINSVDDIKMFFQTYSYSGN